MGVVPFSPPLSPPPFFVTNATRKWCSGSLRKARRPPRQTTAGSRRLLLHLPRGTSRLSLRFGDAQSDGAVRSRRSIDRCGAFCVVVGLVAVVPGLTFFLTAAMQSLRDCGSALGTRRGCWDQLPWSACVPACGVVCVVSVVVVAGGRRCGCFFFCGDRGGHILIVGVRSDPPLFFCRAHKQTTTATRH